jgi:hypothetical protein
MCDCKNNCSMKVETLTLDDGRRAERHISLDQAGNEVVEIFAEEKRPLKLEKRITREMKSVIAKEVHETIKDGEVAFQEVRALEPEAPLQIMSRIGLVDHDKIVDGDYVRTSDIHQLIADGVVAGVSELMERMEPVSMQKVGAQPILKAQQIVEKNVEEGKKSDITVNVIMGVIIAIQVAFFSYIFLM